MRVTHFAFLTGIVGALTVVAADDTTDATPAINIDNKLF